MVYNKRVKKIVIANWKMNPKTAREALSLARAVAKGTRQFSRKVDIVLAPPFPFLNLKPYTTNLKIGAQDVFWKPEGAYTGEISASQLKSLGVLYVIIGHSERRILGETSEIVQKKLLSALKAGLRVVLCVGESEHKRDTAFPPLVREELHTELRGIPQYILRNLIVVYEPIWAISSVRGSKSDNPKNVFEIAILIRRELIHLIGKKRAMLIPILYGGSVDEKNAALFVREGRVDGLLVGGASLRPKSFIGIVRSVAEI